MRTKKTFQWYSYHKLLSYNATYNFVVGPRGNGKTYGAKKIAIRNYLRKGEHFIYLRRYKTELAFRQEFFTDIQNEFPDYSFQVMGSQAQIASLKEVGPETPLNADGTPKLKWKTFGFFITLSNAQARKGLTFPNVTTIIFDEFIIEKGSLHYLPEEEKAFNNFYVTVDRWQDRVRVFFLANTVSIMNPYFIAYDIKPTREFVVKADGFMVINFCDSDVFSQQVETTKFGRFIKNTDYGDFAMGAVFADDNDYLIALKSSEAKYMATIETATGEFSVWFDISATPSMYYIQEGRPKEEVIWTTDPRKMDHDKVYLTYSHRIMQQMRMAFKRGQVLFSSSRARESFIPIFKR